MVFSVLLFELRVWGEGILVPVRVVGCRLPLPEARGVRGGKQARALAAPPGQQAQNSQGESASSGSEWATAVRGLGAQKPCLSDF